MSFVVTTSSCGSCTVARPYDGPCNSPSATSFVEETEEEEDVVASTALSSSSSVTYPLTPVQQELAHAIGQSFRRLRHPDLFVLLPCEDLLSHQDQAAMRASFVSSMEAQLWNVLYMGTSDVWDAIDMYNQINCRVYSVTYLGPDAYDVGAQEFSPLIVVV